MSSRGVTSRGDGGLPLECRHLAGGTALISKFWGNEKLRKDGGMYSRRVFVQGISPRMVLVIEKRHKTNASHFIGLHNYRTLTLFTYLHVSPTDSSTLYPDHVSV